MRSLRPSARAYFFACYLFALGSGAWIIGQKPHPGTTEDWEIAIVLAVLAAVSQVFAVLRPRSNYADHLTPAPLFAAFLLLPTPLVLAVTFFAFVPEWLWRRRPVAVQLFNVASWWIAFAAGQLTLQQLTGHTRLGANAPVPAYAILLTLAVVLGIQTSLIALALKFAWGQSLRGLQFLAPEKLFVEVSLFCSGWAIAAAWHTDPWYGLAAFFPLALIFQALLVPNLREEASTDPKTGLANTRQFNTVMQRELDRARHGGQPLSVMMCDLDYLRDVNNSYGHQAGDVVITGVAQILRQQARGCDLVARFGGEEFCVLLPNQDSHAARDTAERMRKEIERTRFSVGGSGSGVGVTISIGISGYPNDGQTSETLIHEADLAVYQAKRDGRNRVVVAGRRSRNLAAEWARDNLTGSGSSRPIASDRRMLRFVARSARFLSPASGATPAPANEEPPTEPEVATPPVANPPAAPARSGMPRSLKVLITAVFVGGLLSLLPGFLGFGPRAMEPSYKIVLFAILTVIGEQLAVDVNNGRGKISVSVVILLAARLLWGSPGALVTVFTFAAWAKLKARSPLNRMLFNFGMILLSVQAGTTTFEVITGGVDAGRTLTFMVVPAALAGAIYFAVNHALLSLVRGLAESRNPMAVWRDHYQWLLPHYLVFGALSLVVALTYRTFGATGVLAMMAPVAMMHLAVKQYLDRTAVYVDELERMNARLSDSYEATLQALTRALDTRDEETEEHSQRVRKYAELVARRLKLSEGEIKDVSRGALLHDIGKIGVPDAILLKPGKLTAEEMDIMRRHPQIGYSMIAHIPFLSKAAEIVLHHHESYDGRGYPNKLAGDGIPLGARIFAAADTLDAMTSNRPYRKALPYATALSEIQRCRGQQFDPRVVDALLSIPIVDLQRTAREVSSQVVAAPPPPPTAEMPVSVASATS